MTKFSKNLRHLMKQRHLTCRDLAEHLGIKPERINAWMYGRAKPRPEQLIDLCDALDYRELYIMLTVDLQKQRCELKKSLPADVSIGLKEIIDKASQLLKKPQIQ